MTLTDKAVKALQPRGVLYRVADGAGLCVEVHPNGARYWRFRYRFTGKAKMLSLGTYPEISLADARKRLADARRLLDTGFDPSAQRRQDKLTAAFAVANGFGAVAAEWLERQRPKMALTTYTKAQWLLGLVPVLDDRPVGELTAAEVLAALRKIEARGTIESAHRVKTRISQVLRYAVATGRAERDCTLDLRGALQPVVETHRAALTKPDDVARLLRDLDAYSGQPTTCAALRLAPLLFVRPGNLRAMEWSEIDLERAEWRIPAGKMKMGEEHIVPLPAQALVILQSLRPLTGAGRYVFPSMVTRDRPMSENTVNTALRRLGYDKTAMTGHGFRALASTRLNELGWAPDVIERQLAHAERNKVRAAYNRAQYLDERRRMMQAWGDYLDGLRTGANVVPIKRTA